uniref:T-cell leukemia/lymphoma protein 1A n=1 Tax=Halichoerus grypus TaxID=9711 RepID=UPI0016592E30|nr:T-cell leukemia/lymphoma protein 1A [Halichoerus grypus]
MGELPFFRAHTALHPDHLWIWERSVYVDENQRTWLPITIETESSLQVLMRQEDVSLGEAVCPSLLAPCPLPSMWQLYPGRRYRGSDSSFWRIVYHIEASVSFSQGPSGHLGGPCPAAPHVWPQSCIRSPISAPKAKQGKEFTLQVLKGLD